jgi:hypothetical protein
MADYAIAMFVCLVALCTLVYSTVRTFNDNAYVVNILVYDSNVHTFSWLQRIKLLVKFALYNIMV